LSKLPEAKSFASGENAKVRTELSCPLKVITNFWVSTLHSFTVLSKLPEAKYLLSEENAIE
jgi:hypothetical protein